MADAIEGWRRLPGSDIAGASGGVRGEKVDGSRKGATATSLEV